MTDYSRPLPKDLTVNVQQMVDRPGCAALVESKSARISFVIPPQVYDLAQASKNLIEPKNALYMYASERVRNILAERERHWHRPGRHDRGWRK